jgi:hypothetical protein
MIITQAAKNEFKLYINSFKLSKLHETQCSKISDIIKYIDDYFDIELKEHSHRDVLLMIKKNNGVMSKKIMRWWITENYKENYIDNKGGC